MNAKIQLFREIATFLGRERLAEELSELETRLQAKSVRLSIPLVGEFSAGKTSLLNALMDSKKLQVSSKPTTSTIYEIHFGAEAERATIVKEDGSEELVEDIAQLDNAKLGDTPLVRIYDTAKGIGEGLVLIDTPGLSSPEEKHKEVLINFLPKADALFVVIDCNQQITRSIQRFIKEANLAGRKTYLILTKSDTKPASDLQAIKAYIAKNSTLEADDMVCVSAQSGNLGELFALLDKLRVQKQAILEASIASRLDQLKPALLLGVQELLALPQDTEALGKALSDLTRQKNVAEGDIQDIIDHVRRSLDNNVEEVVDNYNQRLFDRLDELLAGKATTAMTAEANTVVSTTTKRCLAEYQAEILRLLQSSVANASAPIQQAVRSLDLSGLDVQIAGFEVDLAKIGHGATEVIGSIGGALVAGFQMYSKYKDGTLEEMWEASEDVATAQKNVEGLAGDTINDFAMGQEVVSGLVSFLAEAFVAKPQRRRAIHEAIDNQFVPEFRFQMQSNAGVLLNVLQEAIQQATAQEFGELEAQIKSLKSELQEEAQKYQSRVAKLKDYQLALG